jgi:hypothetical protein
MCMRMIIFYNIQQLHNCQASQVTMRQAYTKAGLAGFFQEEGTQPPSQPLSLSQVVWYEDLSAPLPLTPTLLASI